MNQAPASSPVPSNASASARDTARQRLLELRKALDARLERSHRPLHKLEAPGGHAPQQSGELADDPSTREPDQTVLAELLAVEQALARLEHGRYFVCGRCGGPIGSTRLAAIPWTQHCAFCAVRA